MLFLRAIPFSFAILWRYAIVLPVLIIAMIIFTILAVLATLIGALVAPVAGALMMISFSVASSVIPIMVGMRVGLQAKWIKPRNNYFGLMLPALGYGLFEGLFILIILVLSAGVYLIATPLTLDDLSTLNPRNEEEFALALLEVSPAVTIGLFVIGVLLVIIMRTALLVPFAGASVGLDPDGKPHTPFMGFGGGFFSNLALVILSYIGSILVIPIVIVLSVPLGVADSLATTMATIEQTPSLDGITAIWADLAIIAGIALVLYLFFFSLQCAGAVLFFEGQYNAVKARHQAYDAETIAEEEAMREPPMQETDLKELLRSRMPERKY